MHAESLSVYRCIESGQQSDIKVRLEIMECYSNKLWKNF